MATAAAACAAADARVKLMCSHGGRLVPCGPGGALRYVGGETRVLAVPRAASFRDLAARLSSEIAGGAEVRAVRHRLADDEGVFVSVTSDEEVAHMLDEYDRLRATRPNAAFRVFVSTSGPGAGVQQQRRGEAVAAGIPHRCTPAAIRRVQSEQALAARAHLHRFPTPMRRVQSAPELARANRLRPPSFHHRCRCAWHQRILYAAAPPPSHGLCTWCPTCPRSGAAIQRPRTCTCSFQCGEGKAEQQRRQGCHGEGKGATSGSSSEAPFLRLHSVPALHCDLVCSPHAWM